MGDMTEAPLEARCSRCSKPAPAVGEPESLDWEGLGNEGGLIVCPDCITPEELF